MVVPTKSGEISFDPGKTYVIKFDWEILDTLDDTVTMTVRSGDRDLASTRLYGVFEGSFNSRVFSHNEPDSKDYRLVFNLQRGGGKVAIDNLQVYDGVAGPWRRDFDNGFVLVNPLNKEYIFKSEELAGQYL